MEQQQQQKCGEALIVCREEDASHRAWRRMRPANPRLLVVQEPNGREAVLHRVVVLQVKGTEKCFSIFREPNVSAFSFSSSPTAMQCVGEMQSMLFGK